MWLNKPNATNVPPCWINNLAIPEMANCKVPNRFTSEPACAAAQVAHAPRRRTADRCREMTLA